MSSLLRQALETKDSLPPPSVLHSDKDKGEDDKCDDLSVYTVQAGDTLMTVSLKSRLSIPTLKKYNRLYGRNSLYTGQVLQLKDPSLQRLTWTDSSRDSAHTRRIVLATAAATTAGGRSKSSSQILTHTQEQDLDQELRHKHSSPHLERGRHLHGTMLEKERLKKALSTPSHNHPTRDNNRSSIPALKASSSFKYKCNSHPDLTSLAPPPSPLDSLPAHSTTPKRRQTLVDSHSSRERQQGGDWGVFAGLTHAPHSSAIEAPSHPSPNGGGVSFSLSSVPRALLEGTLEIFDSYFPSTFTPPQPSPLLKTDAGPSVAQRGSTSAEHNPRLQKFHTQLHGNSSLLLHTHVNSLVEHFPTSLQHEAWELLFSTELHGSDLTSFYHRSAACAYTLIVVRTTDNQVFGGFATEPWRVTKHGREAFFGSGESFLFKCLPFEEGQEEQEDGSVEVFEWKYENYFFQWSNVKQIAMGGGGGHFGFVLDDDFAYAETNPCETFGNPYLTTHTSPFAVSDVELWGFGEQVDSRVGRGEEWERKTSREHKFVMGY